MNVALDFIRDISIKSVAGSEYPQLAFGARKLIQVFEEPVQIETLYDAMNIYEAGCVLGVNNYLGALRKRICNGIVVTMYQVDSRDTIQSCYFLGLASVMSHVGAEAPKQGWQNYSNDPV
ncbi:hypothetical protein DPSP01_012435 [Paraphaeosphaeria sporulosa]